jgi:hypothetical protein
LILEAASETTIAVVKGPIVIIYSSHFRKIIITGKRFI